jgi:hypothetical protein
VNGKSERQSTQLIFETEAGRNATVNGEERRFGGISERDQEFAGSDVGDAIAATNTFLELHSDALKSAISSEGAFDGAKRFEVAEMNGEQQLRNRNGIRVRGGLGIASRSSWELGAKSCSQDAAERAFIHITFEHVVRCPHLKTSDSKFFIGGVSEKY